MKFTTLLLTTVSVASLLIGCSKQSPPPSANPRRPVTNLGTVEVTNGIPVRREIGAGRVCIITPTVLRDGSIELAMVIEEAGKQLAAPTTRTLSDRSVEISVGEITVGLIPQVKQ